jgi:hypothetical protein
VPVGHAGAGEHRVDLGHERGQGGVARRLDQLHAELADQLTARVGGRVVHGDRPVTVRHERAQDSGAGDAQPQHEVVRQSSPPVPIQSA